MARPLLVNAAELLRRSGIEKLVACNVPVAELELVDERFDPTSMVEIHLRLESLTDGIVVDGRVSAPYHGVCRRCLKPLSALAISDINELYQLVVTDDSAFPIVGDQLNLVTMVRDSLLLDTPALPLCRDDCAGLCPTCGVDHNVESCACASLTVTSPWDVLNSLRSELDEK